MTVCGWGAESSRARSSAGGSSISTCSETPSSASTVSGWPRSWPSPSGAAVPRRTWVRPIAIRSTATTAPAPAATAPAARPATPVIRRQVAIPPPCRAPRPGGRPAGGASGLRPRHRARQPRTRGLTVLVCYSTVSSRYSAGKVRHDLVGNRAQGVRPLLGGGLSGVARAEQHHLVAGLSRLGPEVQHGQVHAVGVGHGPPLTAGQQLHDAGGSPGDPLGVTQRDQPQGALALGGVVV